MEDGTETPIHTNLSIMLEVTASRSKKFSTSSRSKHAWPYRGRLSSGNAWWMVTVGMMMLFQCDTSPTSEIDVVGSRSNGAPAAGRGHCLILPILAHTHHYDF